MRLGNNSANFGEKNVIQGYKHKQIETKINWNKVEKGKDILQQRRK